MCNNWRYWWDSQNVGNTTYSFWWERFRTMLTCILGGFTELRWLNTRKIACSLNTPNCGNIIHFDVWAFYPFPAVFQSIGNSLWMCKIHFSNLPIVLLHKPRKTSHLSVCTLSTPISFSSIHLSSSYNRKLKEQNQDYWEAGRGYILADTGHLSGQW